MDYAKATKYADISVNLVDSLIAYSKDLKSDFENNYSELTVIYSFCINIDRKQEDVRLQNIKQKFESLPIYYHSNVLELFITRFQNEILLDKNKEDLTHTVLEIEDVLMDYAQYFEKSLKRIPSIFEVLFLYLQGGLKYGQHKEQLSCLLSNVRFQHRVLCEFCNKYQEIYQIKLKRTVYNNETQI